MTRLIDNAMHYDDNIYAELVHDYEATVVPVRMGVAKPTQLRGTDLERLAEMAGRVCYDSLGTGRGSAEFHQHVKEVGHLSVYEHCVWTVSIGAAFPSNLRHLYGELLNRPGVWCREESSRLLLTLNMRAALEWEAWHPEAQDNEAARRGLTRIVQSSANFVMPEVMPKTQSSEWGLSGFNSAIVRPRHDEERWITLLIGGSRGMSHELVRHGDRTAISQRSTRYVDESESPWVEHPVVTAYRDEARLNGRTGEGLDDINPVIPVAREQYVAGVSELESWLESAGVSRTQARKQARGAMRGSLGNALHTELIFSASIAQWKRILRQRATDAADAEIRVLSERIVNALRTSCWSEDFNYDWVAASDRIGRVIQ